MRGENFVEHAINNIILQKKNKCLITQKEQ